MASVLTPTKPPEPVAGSGSPEIDPKTRERLEAVIDEKRRALAEPGLSWRDWLLFQALKWWMIIIFLILDSWIAAEWIEVGFVLGMVPTLAVAVYLEFLLFQYLWARPAGLRRPRRGEFHATWFRPFECGRWTPEAALRARGVPEVAPGAIDPDEFL